MAQENFDDTFNFEDEELDESASFSFEDEEIAEEGAPFDFEDEFDRLRQKTARTSAVFDDMEMEEELEYEDERSFLGRISPGQRLVLLLILLLDIVIIAVGVMAILRVI